MCSVAEIPNRNRTASAGRGDDEGVRRSGWSALGLAAVCMCTTASLLALAPETLTGFFIDVHNPANAPVVGLAISFLHVAALFQLFDGAQAIAAGALRGLKDTRFPMVMCFVGYCVVGLLGSLLLAFPFGLGARGVWLGLFIGLLATAALLTTRFHRQSRRLARVLPRGAVAPIRAG